jgi:hypothetical protein
MVLRRLVPSTYRPVLANRVFRRLILRSHPELLGLLTLTWFFNLRYGPVEVALPLHVTDDLHGPGTLLGLYWMCCSASARCSAGSQSARRGTCRCGLWRSSS